MKYGQYLTENIAPEYGSNAYLNYKQLDQVIRSVSGRTALLSTPPTGQRQISLSTPAPTNIKGQPTNKSSTTHEEFFQSIDKEIAKVESFTLQEVTNLRKALDTIEMNAHKANNLPEEKKEGIRKDVEDIGDAFIRLEKYVNINFMGFHKILKKHDRHIPHNPCRAFYVKRMHDQAWVRGDYSDVVVRLSDIFRTLRDDAVASAEVNGEASAGTGSFLRSTTKYWVKTEDVSRVKYWVLKHLPVFLQKTSTGESDSQLTNSVYYDNDQLELYHGRLDKTPGAIALRLRWYGTGEPTTVFVERKTHRDSWTGEVSVKERFTVKEHEVKQVVTDTYPMQQRKAKMKDASNISEKDADDWEGLVSEITQVIQSKQLVPTMRTQYMRTAFQIPFDATVRISLDTNLCMISERGYDTRNGEQWHRDSNQTLLNTQITRFPHAVLEIKLELSGENITPPVWVQELQNSGLLFEVHKFSKFIHGCATLLPDYVRSVPYWIDDSSVRDSIIASGAGKILVKTVSQLEEEQAASKSNEKQVGFTGAGPGANMIYSHLLPFGTITENKKDIAVGRVAGQLYPSNSASNLLPMAQETVTSTTTPTEIPPPTRQPKIADYSLPSPDDDDEDEVCCGNIKWCKNLQGYDLSVIAPTAVQKIEPKLFFANERTFLHWLHAGVILSTIAAGILAFVPEGDQDLIDGGNDIMYSKYTHWYAMALLPISLGFCLYALHIFLWRADRIKTRIPGRWDDPRGPMILGGTLLTVLCINFCIKIYEIVRYF